MGTNYPFPRKVGEEAALRSDDSGSALPAVVFQPSSSRARAASPERGL